MAAFDTDAHGYVVREQYLLKYEPANKPLLNHR